MTANNATLQHDRRRKLSTPLGDPTVPAFPLPDPDPVPAGFPLTGAPGVPGATHVVHEVTALQHLVFLALSVTVMKFLVSS